MFKKSVPVAERIKKIIPEDLMMKKMDYKKKLQPFMHLQVVPGSLSLYPSMEKAQPALTKRTSASSNNSVHSGKRSFSSSCFPKEKNAPIIRKPTALHFFPQVLPQIPYRSDFWENTVYATSIPIIKRKREIRFPTATPVDWKWNTFFTGKKVITKTCRRKSPLF